MLSDNADRQVLTVGDLGLVVDLFPVSFEFMKRSFLLVFCFAALSVLLAGCDNSPSMVIVTGTVLFDGRPLADASVDFEPVDGSRGSSGATDASGVYTLQYSPTRAGALPGEHKVTIRTVAGEPDSENPALKEILPAKYHSATELKATLKSGRQTVDFDLTP